MQIKLQTFIYKKVNTYLQGEFSWSGNFKTTTLKNFEREIMKFVNRGTVLSNNSYVVEENSKEYKRIQAALNLYGDLESGKLAKNITEQIVSKIGGDDLW